MTCIIGLEEDGKAWIGADTMITAGWQQERSTLPKVFRKGKFTVASSGSLRFSQILRYLITFPEIDVDDDEYVIAKLCEEIRTKCKELGYSEVNNNKEKTEDYTIIGFNNKIYEISSNFSVVHPSDGCVSIGSGNEFALGAMMALKGAFTPKRRIELALKVASYYNIGVDEPFDILEV